MKSITAVCQTGASMPAIKPNGRVARHPQHRGDGENAEMKMYLSKLKDLVPFMPKNRKLSKLEIIQNVIDYICDLQTELETHPQMGNFDAAAALNFVTSQNNMEDDADNEDEHDILSMRLSADASVQQSQQNSSLATTRQPLVDRQAPNTILPSSSYVTMHMAQMQLLQQQQQQQQQLLSQTQLPQQNSSAAEKDKRSTC